MRPQLLPTKEIRFASRMGFLSKPIWEEFFASGSDRWKRRQWQIFTERKLFVSHPSRFAKDVLVLYRRNAEVRRITCDAIVLPPFAPQIEHDECVARILLGLERSGHIRDYQVEAEIKRLEWGERRLYSGTEKTKYPDGVVEIVGPTKRFKIAIEIELSRKSSKRYRQVFKSYSARKDLTHILFVARSNLIFESLKSAMREAYYANGERPIGFCDLDAWLKSPGQAPIYFSDGQTNLERIAV